MYCFLSQTRRLSLMMHTQLGLGLASASASRFINNPVFVASLLLSSAAAKPLSTASSIVKEHDVSLEPTSFTVSYLVNSCGLSLEKAKSASKRVQFDSPDRPDSVLNVLRNQGFSNTQIARLVVKAPVLLLTNVDKYILPKLQFFESIGLSPEERAKILSANPVVLSRSLEFHLVPTLNYFKSLIGSNERIVKALKCNTWIFLVDVEKTLVANITSLRQCGFPERLLPHFMTRCVGVLLRNHDKFDEILKEVIRKGYCTSKSAFVQAMHVFSLTTEAFRENKLDLFRKWGIPENGIQSLMKNFPQVILVSEEKLRSKLDFIVNEMGWEPDVIGKHPVAMLASLEKKIKPRCLVIKALLRRGLIADKMNLGSLIRLTDKQFIDRYVKTYTDDVPQLLDIYQRKKVVQDCEGMKFS